MSYNHEKIRVENLVTNFLWVGVCFFKFKKFCVQYRKTNDFHGASLVLCRARNVSCVNRSLRSFHNTWRNYALSLVSAAAAEMLPATQHW